MQKPEQTIKFVKEYLADTGCKTKEEVQSNLEAAYAYCGAYGYVGDYAAYGACAAYAARAIAADTYAYADSAARANARAEYWINKYEELTNAK